jgi:hypothetical protein
VSSNYLSWHYLLSSSQLIFVSLGCSAGGTLPLALLWLLVFLSLGRLISSGAAQCTRLQLAHISFALVMAYKHLPARDSDVACVLDAPYKSAVAASPTIATSSGYPGRGRSRCLLVARRCSTAQIHKNIRPVIDAKKKYALFLPAYTPKWRIFFALGVYFRATRGP